MFAKGLLIAFMVITGAIFACGNNLTDSEKELVGTWKFVGIDFGDLEFYNFYQIVPRIEIRFNSDNTWESDYGDRGTWRISNKQIIRSDDTGEIDKITYFLDGNDLTLIFTKSQFLRYLKQRGYLAQFSTYLKSEYVVDENGEVTEKYNRLREQFLKPNGMIRFFFASKVESYF